MINTRAVRRAARRRTTLELVTGLARDVRALYEPPTYDELPPAEPAPEFVTVDDYREFSPDVARARAAFSCEARDCWHITQREVLMNDAARRERQEAI